MKQLISLFLVLVPLVLFAQQKPGDISKEVQWLKESLLKYHVAPKVLDDQFSSDVFDKILADLDPDKLFLTEADILLLGRFRNLIDGEIKGKPSMFLHSLKERLRNGLQRSEDITNGILASAIDWKQTELYQPSLTWSKDEQELIDRHRRWLKFQILDRLADLSQKDSVLADDFFSHHLNDVAKHVHVTTLRPLKRLLKDPSAYDIEISSAFLNSIAGVFDPHSSFFSPADFDDFIGALSTEDYYFGFTLAEDGKGNIFISALAPGGAAWKSGALQVSDILLSIQWVGRELIDVSGMELDDVTEMLAGNSSALLEVTVRAADKSQKKVTLKKERLQQDENAVQSFILEGDIKSGYIYLPDFYTRWEDENRGGESANDVAKEILKLKKEGIEGLILDLRFNGGGSLYEAMAMAGIFIDEGPLAVIATRDQKAVTLKDLNRGTVYDGPLVLMVNGYSASASEVLAGVIQDYNRGLIVGSKTYGKASGQNIFPLEEVSSAPLVKRNPEKKSGYVKITTQKLYRVTGKSAQGLGVTPDVELPDIFAALNAREDLLPFALPADSISKNTYYKPLRPLDRKALQDLSRERLSGNHRFQELQKTIVWLKARVRENADPQPLTWEKFVSAAAEARVQRAIADKTLNMGEKIYTVTNTELKQQRLTVDEYASDGNRKWLQKLSIDIYLQETYQILRDYITLNQKL
jgi:carboxyl-terminal processing protease